MLLFIFLNAVHIAVVGKHAPIIILGGKKKKLQATY